MTGKMESVTCYPCHIYGIEDPKEADKMNDITRIKEYGSYLLLEDSFTPHLNYPDCHEEGERILMRCNICGGLILRQFSKVECPYWDEPDEYYHDYVPVASVAEADLLNILWNGKELAEYPFRHLKRNDHSIIWTDGKKPEPYDPEELKKKIREKYAGLSPKHREMLEKMISQAGKL